MRRTSEEIYNKLEILDYYIDMIRGWSGPSLQILTTQSRGMTHREYITAFRSHHGEALFVERWVSCYRRRFDVVSKS